MHVHCLGLGKATNKEFTLPFSGVKEESGIIFYNFIHRFKNQEIYSSQMFSTFFQPRKLIGSKDEDLTIVKLINGKSRIDNHDSKWKYK